MVISSAVAFFFQEGTIDRLGDVIPVWLNGHLDVALGEKEFKMTFWRIRKDYISLSVFIDRTNQLATDCFLVTSFKHEKILDRKVNEKINTIRRTFILSARYLSMRAVKSEVKLFMRSDCLVLHIFLSTFFFVFRDITPVTFASEWHN